MTSVPATMSKTHIRAVVYREDQSYVAQCLEYDIAAQATDLDMLLRRLHLTVEAEFVLCDSASVSLPPAPAHYHEMWRKSSVALPPIPGSASGSRPFSIAAALVAAA
jgi:hypothetical protein